MMKFNRSRSLLGVLTVLCTLVLVSTAYARKKGEIKVKFASFAEPPEGLEFYLAKIEKTQDGEIKYHIGEEEVKLGTKGFSDDQVAPSRQCALISKPENAGEKPKFMVPLKLPSPGRHFLVVLVPDQKTRKPRAEIIAADRASLKDGGVMVMNLSQHTIFSSLEEKKKAIKAGTTHFHSPSKTQNTGTYPVKFGFKNAKGKNRIFKTASWPYSKGRRSFVFFYDGKKGRAPEMRGIDEYTHWLD